MPAFSSRGDRIAFTSQRDGDYEIYILQLNADGSPGQLERVTNSPGRDMHPRFSPDDKWLLFTSQRGGLNDELPLLRVIFLPQPYGELHAIRLEDKAVFRLTHDKWEDGPSAWKRWSRQRRFQAEDARPSAIGYRKSLDIDQRLSLPKTRYGRHQHVPNGR
jgi:hypothetical protein